MAEKDTQIPGKLTSIALERLVADADEIWDELQQKRQNEINHTFNQEISSLHDDLETSEHQIEAEQTRAEAAEAVLQGMYETINANDIIVGPLPDTGQLKKIYRVPGDARIVYLGASNFAAGKTIRTDGDIADHSSQSYNVSSYDVSEYDEVFIAGYNPSGGSNVLAAFYDTDDVFIGPPIHPSSPTGAIYDVYQEVPEGAVTLKVCGASTATASVGVYSGTTGTSYTDWMWYNGEWVKMATFTISNEPLLVGLYTCDTAEGTAAKTVEATGFQLPNNGGGAIKIKMTNANTVNSATLEINGTGIKALFYDGERASSTNSWEAGEIVEVYYDPAGNSGHGAYYAYKMAGGGGEFATGEKVKETSIDAEPVAESSNLVKSGGVYSELRNIRNTIQHQNLTFVQGSTGTGGTPNTNQYFIRSSFAYPKCTIKVNEGFRIYKYVEYSSPDYSAASYIGENTSGSEFNPVLEYTGNNYIVVVVKYDAEGTNPITPDVDCIEDFIIAGNLQDRMNAIEASLSTKLSQSDIVDNLTTDDSTKPLSAKQGKILYDSVSNSEALEAEWSEKTFLLSDGTTGATSKFNSVGTVDIGLYNKLTFDFSIINGGSSSKYGWIIKDNNNAIVEHSEEYAANRMVGQTHVELSSLPEGAKTLLLSWDTNLGSTPSIIGTQSMDAVYDKFNALAEEENDISEKVRELNVHNIENDSIEAYLNVKYNNGDYSYTKLPYAQVGNYWVPRPIRIDTPVHDTAVSRTLEIADNGTYIEGTYRSYDIGTTDTYYDIYNLEPNKLYHYRIYYDGSATNLITSGTFRTKGRLRELYIPATLSDHYNIPYIGNARDIGGWSTDNGQHIRYGVIIRGRELNENIAGEVVTYITQAGIAELTGIGVSAELDLRTEDSLITESALGSGVAYSNITVDLLFYRLNVSNNVIPKLQAFANAIRQIIAWIKVGKSIYVHCAGGCDRTGALCTFIEGVCGVSENDINHDYELSIRDRNRDWSATYTGDFRYAMEYIKGLLEYGGNFYVCYQSNYYGYGTNGHVQVTDPALIAALSALPFGTLKERFHRLMRLGGMAEREMEELEMLLCA